jgi:hypothetical protein
MLFVDPNNSIKSYSRTDKYKILPKKSSLYIIYTIYLIYSYIISAINQQANDEYV